MYRIGYNGDKYMFTIYCQLCFDW